MNRIAFTIEKIQQKGGRMLVPYLTPEFPVPGATLPALLALEKSGASMIELGIPFSDPLADGPTIQQASETAIRNGATLLKVLDLVGQARRLTSIPIILMGYVNPIMRYGFDRFFADAAAAGVDGLIIPDLPPEESTEYRAQCEKHGISIVFLIAPTSSDERIRYLDSLSTHFSYCVSVTGVTGSRTSFGADFGPFLARVKKNTVKPFVVGFGIAGKEQVREVTGIADGAVVGSALLKSLDGAATPEETARRASQFLSGLV